MCEAWRGARDLSPLSAPLGLSLCDTLFKNSFHIYLFGRWRGGLSGFGFSTTCVLGIELRCQVWWQWLYPLSHLAAHLYDDFHPDIQQGSDSKGIQRQSRSPEVREPPRSHLLRDRDQSSRPELHHNTLSLTEWRLSWVQAKIGEAVHSRTARAAATVTPDSKKGSRETAHS